MPPRRMHRGKSASPAQATTGRGEPQRKDPRLHNKEANYLLQIEDADLELVRRYHTVLSQAAGGFAEQYYNYLFDNPATAEVLYRYEHDGGDIGDLVRTELAHLIGILDARVDDDSAARLVDVGCRHHQRGVRPLWMLGAYRLYLEHLQDTVAGSPQVDRRHKERLDAALVKLVFRDVGMVVESFWHAELEQAAAARSAAIGREQRVEDLLSNIPQILWSVDVPGDRVLYASPTVRDLCGGEPQAPIPCLERIHPEDREQVLEAWHGALASGERTQIECRLDTQGAGDRWYRLCLYPYRARRRSKVARVDGLLEDATDAHQALTRLQRMATTGELTGLANRTLWHDRLNQALAAGRREGAAQVVVMILDMDHFKLVNDTLGHSAGDGLLRQVGERLRTALRDSDTLARLGGDEFAVLLPAVSDGRRAAERVANKLIGCFSAPLLSEGRELYLSTAVGIAVYPEHGEDADSLLSHADIAMYRAKRSQAPYMFYDPQSDASSTLQLQMSGQLRQALDGDEFELHYQPRLDLTTGEACGVEALLRWNHPRDGMVLPKSFLNIAEQVGLMGPITEWVLDTALAQCRTWRAAGVHMPVSINVSARSFQHSGFVDVVAAALERSGVDGRCLEIEITEDTLMGDLDHGARVLAHLAELGVGVAVDDFGTGYSSLAYLKRLPINTLKIDRSFLQDMATDENDAVIVRSIIDLGHNLGFRVVAEGVENQHAWDLLSDLGCDEVQGYHISRPLPLAGIAEWLAQAPQGAPPRLDG